LSGYYQKEQRFLDINGKPEVKRTKEKDGPKTKKNLVDLQTLFTSDKPDLSSILQADIAQDKESFPVLVVNSWPTLDTEQNKPKHAWGDQKDWKEHLSRKSKPKVNPPRQKTVLWISEPMIKDFEACRTIDFIFGDLGVVQ